MNRRDFIKTSGCLLCTAGFPVVTPSEDWFDLKPNVLHEHPARSILLPGERIAKYLDMKVPPAPVFLHNGNKNVCKTTMTRLNVHKSVTRLNLKDFAQLLKKELKRHRGPRSPHEYCYSISFWTHETHNCYIVAFRGAAMA